MMKKRRHIRKLTVERERAFIFRRHAVVQTGWCKQCGVEVEFSTVAEAARETGLSELVVYRLIEAGDLHFLQEDDVNILACLNSLRSIQQRLKTAIDELDQKEESHGREE
jgi:hypothetical protein